MNENKKIYIIGPIPGRIDKNCVRTFSETHDGLKKLGFTAINPVERLLKLRSVTSARKKNLKDLITSDAVYIMPDSSLDKGMSNLEIKIAISMNLTIVSGIFIVAKNSKNELTV